MMFFSKTNPTFSKIIIIVITVIIIILFLAWLFIEPSKPLPGTKIADLGRGHVPVGEQVEYNSNPPTSGKHYADWIRAGIYNESKDDRNLVHSLEHGYVIMHYKCKDARDECDQRKSQLEEIYNKKEKRKLIVVSRENLDSDFALTAWTYIDKFNDFDVSRIEKFIDAHRDQGPERTME